ncbi:hypothetical protein LCGC14_1861280 [marine sediment metagenome]|uniref:Uncharacterized protein n=1 Tax=marine sediment metagenome TaxID=412755 RepID=A0A0F9ILY9_9ZZZZ
MDTGTDFIQPEFLNILFFQQKNLVIFPYVDLKHLHYLELFTIGYNVVDLDSTALHNMKDILEFEASNDYSQNPTLFFISNVNKLKLKEIMELENIHCIINSNENLSELVNGSSFVFFNKKSNQFLNYNINSNLEFEKSLISSSNNKETLQDKIQKIKMVATKIFTELNQEEKPNIPAILNEYNKSYWQQIIDYTSSYYDINIPKLEHNMSTTKRNSDIKLKDYSEEYEKCVSNHKEIGKEFILLLHEYRTHKVNPAHLGLEELFNPQKLYTYLRNHHWRSGIPSEFIQKWAQMSMSRYQLDENEKKEFEQILGLMNVYIDFKEQKIKPYQQILKRQRKSQLENKKIIPPIHLSELIPSVKKEWHLFKEWLENKLNMLESLSDPLNDDKVVLLFKENL